jgi:hypothetical protein
VLHCTDVLLIGLMMILIIMILITMILIIAISTTACALIPDTLYLGIYIGVGTTYLFFPFP